MPYVDNISRSSGVLIKDMNKAAGLLAWVLRITGSVSMTDAPHLVKPSCFLVSHSKHAKGIPYGLCFSSSFPFNT